LASAEMALAQSAADGVMVGRGAYGRPWRLAQIAAGLAGRAIAATPPPMARLALVLEHYEAMLAFYGRDTGVRHARKHLAWYLADLPDGRALASRVNRLDAPEAVVAALREAFEKVADGPALAA
jgi:tRNA-dihydrouridine synthase B